MPLFSGVRSRSASSRRAGQGRATAAGLLAFALLAAGCAAPDPIRIGFAGELTGDQSDLGIEGRDGALLAVDDLNTAGGVAGRRLELLVRDDLGTLEGAAAADRALIDDGVVAVIGHMTSGQTLAGLAVTQPAGMVLFSPTASTPELSGRDDLFFRVITPAPDLAFALSRYAAETAGLGRVAILLDLDNAGYTLPFAEAFSADLQARGGQVVRRQAISSAENPDFAVLVRELEAAEPDGVLLVLSAVDAALFAQQARLSGWAVPLVAAPWAQTETLLRAGGGAVEGMVFSAPYDLVQDAPALRDFQSRYEARFGRAPGFAAALAYESVHVLAAALRRTGGSADGLPEALAQGDRVAVLGGELALDAHGDVVRPVPLVSVQAGAYRSLEAFALVTPGAP